jgi:SAM-dependent methyltransferase
MTRRAAQHDQFARIAPHYDALMANVPYWLWAKYVCSLAAVSGRPILPGCQLLDLATGTGSVALEFAQAGCIVTGLDLSPPMIAQARQKARRRRLEVRFLCRDVADFDLPPDFDHAVCLYDSLNYLLDPDHIELAFANTRRALKEDGLFIFDVNTIHALEAELFTQQSRPDAEVAYRWKSRYDPKTCTSTIRMSFTVAATGERIRIVHRQRAYGDTELRSLLHHAGFGEVSAYDGYRVAPPDAESDRVFYVAKPRP